MGLETGSYIGDLNAANPSGTDPKSQGDDHIRLLKTAARNSFPGFTGVVAGTGVESGSGNAFVVALSPGPAAYAAGMLVVFKATHANSGPATLQVNALTAKTLKAVDGSALESGDVEAGAIVGAFYDGTDFFLISGADRAARGGDSYTGAHDFTGASVQVATAGAGDNSTKAASTAYVDAADALKANLASPALTGVPTAPTAAPGTNTTQVATTAFATQLAFQAALPVQTGQGGKFLKTNGSAASWEDPIASQAEAEAGTASDRLMSAQRTAQAIAALARSAPEVIVEQRQISGTNGVQSGSTAGLNTIVRNVDAMAILASNQVILPAGKWLLAGWVLMGSVANFGPAGKAVVYNATASAELGRGSVAIIGTGTGGGPLPGISHFSLVVSLAVSTAIELRVAGNGSERIGAAVSLGTEVYAHLEATRAP